MHLQIDMSILADFCGEPGGKPRDMQEFCAPVTRKIQYCWSYTNKQILIAIISEVRKLHLANQVCISS